MTPQFKDIIHRYLHTEISYALLIDGKWGSGKTWYIKNRFEEDFGKKVVYISANGITSMDDLTQQVLYRKLYLSSNLVSNPKAKLAYSIVKEFGKSMLNKYTGFDTDKLSDLGVDLNDFASINSDEVLIIDDIERMKEGSLEEFLGFVSKNFTEENGFKVILIADEKKLIEKFVPDEKKYLEIKEKTIWQTIEFKLDYDKVIPSLTSLHSPGILEVYPEFNTDVITFLQKHKISNLRTILYAFTCVDDVIHRIPDKNHLPTVIKSILILTNEYKAGRLNYRLGEHIPDFIKTTTPTISWNWNNEVDFEPSDAQIFSQTYLDKSPVKYYFFESLYHLVCHGLLNEELLTQELEDFQKSQEVPNPALKAVQKMFDYRHLSDAEFNETINEVLGYLEEGLYDIYNAANIIKNFDYFLNIRILDISKKEFESKLEAYIARIDPALELPSAGIGYIKPEDFKYLSEGQKYFEQFTVKLEERKQKNISEQKTNFIEALKEEKELPESFSFLFENFQKDEVENLAKHYSKHSGSLEKLYRYFRDNLNSVKEMQGHSLNNYHFFIEMLKVNLNGQRIAMSIVEEIESLKKV
jgi:hypothetical protein